MKENQNHHPLSPVCIGLADKFGMKCSCNEIHPSVMLDTDDEKKIEMDTTHIWSRQTGVLIPVKDKVVLPFRRSHWGMTKM